MPTRNVHLTERLDAFITSSVEDGRYHDAGEVIGEGLDLLEQRDQEDKARLEWLREAAREGIASLDRGEGTAFTSMEAMAEHLRGLAREAAAKVNASQSVG